MYEYGTERQKPGPSNVLNSVPLTGGDGGDLGHCCAEIVVPGLRAVGVGGGLSGRVLAIRREGARTKRSGRWP